MKNRWLVINLTFGFIEKVFSTEAKAKAYHEKYGDHGSYHSTKDVLTVIPLEFTKDDKGRTVIVRHDPKKAHADYDAEAMKKLSKLFGGSK